MKSDSHTGRVAANTIHFSITSSIQHTTKQSYLPSSNILYAQHHNEKGVAIVTDFLLHNPSNDKTRRMADPVRLGHLRLYDTRHGIRSFASQDVSDTSVGPLAYPLFSSLEAGLRLELHYVTDSGLDVVLGPIIVELKLLDLTPQDHLDPSAYAISTL
ncbi:hypothetical protein OBBRIDRAFT_833130 [Obba rivulosa]|uniref:Uncharacterized protein n=1 Tax=Obba rivulosa TaxID=1052685 RepID=A0A8E2B390_9APHY|nr:hypothetical protein OBBRIDRAFT_833130 [Obba rivulosa]